MKVTYRHATVADIPAIVNLKLAPKDAQEALDGSGCSSTRSALAKCLEISKVTWVIEDSSGIIGVFGLGSREGQVHPWLLGSQRLHTDHWFAMCRHGRSIVNEWSERFPEMLNIVWCENRKVIRWLKWLGFGFPDVEPVPINGRNYLIFKINGGT